MYQIVSSLVYVKLFGMSLSINSQKTNKAIILHTIKNTFFLKKKPQKCSLIFTCTLYSGAQQSYHMKTHSRYFSLKELKDWLHLCTTLFNVTFSLRDDITGFDLDIKKSLILKMLLNANKSMFRCV